MQMDREKIINTGFGNWKRPLVINFSPLIKQMKNLRPTDEKGYFTAYFAGHC